MSDWHTRYSVTCKPRYVETSRSLLDLHLISFFGSRDIRGIEEADLLDYVRTKLEAVQRPATIQNALLIVRRVLNLAVRYGLLVRNPANGIGRLIARVARREDREVPVADAWTRPEAELFLTVAEQHEPRFAPLLRFPLSTGARHSEALNLEWRDVDSDRGRISIRRALTKGQPVTPKSGKGRVVVMAPSLASALFDLLAQRRVEATQRGWSEPPVWVFCSEAATPLDERNVTRSWDRVRRRAHKLGVRPLRLHAARHTFATLALEAGRSIRFVAEQPGHANPELTLRVYAHALPVEGGDMGFADFSRTADVAERLYPSPGIRVGRVSVERETGFEPATLSLGS